MDVTELVVDESEAMRLYRAYKTHQHFEKPIDAEIRRTYHALATGRTVIKALESIVKAGVHDDGTPKLGIVRADQSRCLLNRDREGSFSLSAPGFSRKSRAAGDMRFSFPTGSLPVQSDATSRGGWWQERQTIVPLVPIHLRPKRALAAYHILWEVEQWTLTVPRDPYLLRRIGKGDLWLVLAAWDLTEIERAALQSRIGVQ